MTPRKYFEDQPTGAEIFGAHSELLDLVKYHTRYKSELKSALDRTVAMQRSHDGEHLEWQRRLEVSEQQQHQRNEGIVESLMKARDEVRHTLAVRSFAGNILHSSTTRKLVHL